MEKDDEDLNHTPTSPFHERQPCPRRCLEEDAAQNATEVVAGEVPWRQVPPEDRDLWNNLDLRRMPKPDDVGLPPGRVMALADVWTTTLGPRASQT